MSLPKPYYQTDLGVLYHGDCLDILPLLDPVDLVLTDPPYGIGESSRKNNSRSKPFGSRKDQKNTRGTLIKPIDYGFYDWDKKPASPLMIKLCVSAGERAIIWGGNFFNLPPSQKWLVWDKINSGCFADCELAWTNIAGAVRIFRHMWNGMLRQSERNIKRVHPTQKPIALMSWCLQFYYGTVLDPFIGSGTTAIACEQLNRGWIGIEISERYCEIAANRIEKEREQLKLFPQFEPEQTKLKQASIF